MNKFKVFLILIILTAFLTACPPLDKREITITSLGWVIENIDRNYWINGPNASMFLYLEVNYEGNITSPIDIESIHISNASGTNWTFEQKGFLLNLEDKRIILRGLHGDVNDKNSNRLALGEYLVSLKLVNGSHSQKSMIIPEPGKAKKGSNSYVYSEDHTGPTNGGTAMLKRSLVLGSPKKDSHNITLSFDCDELTHNGWIRFNNSEQKYVGKTPLFFDKTTWAPAWFLNNGTGLNSTGSNRITLSKADIIYDSDFSFGDISSFVIYVTDGQQFTDSYDFNYIAFSNSILFD